MGSEVQPVPEVRPVRPEDLSFLDPALAGPLFDQPARAWGRVATVAGRPTGYLLTALLFGTWQATDTLDIHRLHLVDPDDGATADALHDAARRQAAEQGLTGVRWFRPEGAGAAAPPEVDVREKLRFTWDDPSADATAAGGPGPGPGPAAMADRIRPASPADLPELVRLCAAHAHYERADPPAADLATRLGERIFAPDPRVWCLVVEADDQRSLAGYASCVREFDAAQVVDFLHMDCLYLDPRQRGGGIGTRVMHRLAAHARALRLGSVRWQTPTWNVDAVRFYERLGATSVNATQCTVTVDPG